MQKIFSISFLFILVISSYSQTIALEIMNTNTIIHNINNPIKIVYEGNSCSNIFIKTEAIFEKKKACTWLIKPIADYDLPGLAIDIFKTEHGDTILLERRYLKVRRLETLTPDIGLFHDLDTISYVRLNAQIRITVTNYQWYNIGCSNGEVIRFNCLAIREDKIIGYITNQGAKFNKECKLLFKKLQTNDELHFINIVANSPFRRGERLNSIKLVVN
jgi:hypothetical protein